MGILFKIGLVVFVYYGGWCFDEFFVGYFYLFYDFILLGRFFCIVVRYDLWYEI